LKVWDLEHGKELVTLSGHTMPVHAIAITPDGTRVVTGSKDMTLKVWDLERGGVIATLSGHSGTVWSLAITPDGKHVISGSSDGTSNIWNLENGQQIRHLIHGSSVWAVTVTPDGRHAISGARDGTVKLWLLDIGMTLARYGWADHPVAVHAGRAGGIRALTTIPREDGSVSRPGWLAWAPEQAWDVTILFAGQGALAVASDGERLVDAGSVLKVRDLRSGRIRTTRTGQAGVVCAVAVTPDGLRSVTTGSDGTLRVWDLERVPESSGASQRRPLRKKPQAEELLEQSWGWLDRPGIGSAGAFPDALKMPMAALRSMTFTERPRAERSRAERPKIDVTRRSVTSAGTLADIGPCCAVSMASAEKEASSAASQSGSGLQRHGGSGPARRSRRGWPRTIPSCSKKPERRSASVVPGVTRIWPRRAGRWE
jgi:WD domain, G-beta repeat